MLYLANSFFENLVDEGDLIPYVAIIAGTVVVAMAIVFGTVKSIVIARSRENTKRELAAYVSEGRLEPDKAVAMLNAGRSKDDADA